MDADAVRLAAMSSGDENAENGDDGICSGALDLKGPTQIELVGR